MRPVIGITTHISDDERTLQLNRAYTEVLLQAGALPILLPATTDTQVISQYAAQVNGLLLSGGGDVDPLLFGETAEWACGAVSPLRDEFELKLCVELLRASGKPILGICRGFQLLNVALGGSLYQDLQTCFEGKTIAHRQKQRAVYASHAVTVAQGTRLHAIIGEEQLMVNSLHHQGLKLLPDGFTPSATAQDGVIEAAELAGHPFCMGVQWHPEQLWNQPGCDAHKRLFTAFVEACGCSVR